MVKWGGGRTSDSNMSSNQDKSVLSLLGVLTILKCLQRLKETTGKLLLERLLSVSREPVESLFYWGGHCRTGSALVHCSSNHLDSLYILPQSLHHPNHIV
uniref:Uncharacterized protein n=1 Tax=Anguilla anguilla TaxID=7936 RepID=A0A0E9W938_ANGAN